MGYFDVKFEVKEVFELIEGGVFDEIEAPRPVPVGFVHIRLMNDDFVISIHVLRYCGNELDLTITFGEFRKKVKDGSQEIERRCCPGHRKARS